MDITLSLIKADVGGYVGHSSCHPDLLDKAKESMEHAKQQGLLIDHHVTACGDDLQLIMTHQKGQDNEQIHKLAWNTFVECTAVAKKLKLHGAGQDLLTNAFSGNVRGMGPGVAEMQIAEREAESIIIFMADKTASGAFNLPLYKIFADPFNTIGLVIASNMHSGFVFEVHDVLENKKVSFNTPEDTYDMLVLI
ncbi:MAG: fructose 1,6-bisphosphatase, partial [Chloroflexota bacterium]|nr:fructose 1,6-bisphosphatase [Chloroflexota bacterium]